MAKILVVDDERSYRTYLDRILSGDGHEVRTAATGRQAIEVGSRFRPDVLVVDWMLRDDFHGLHVAAALRSVKPDLQAILITGFPSHDLQEDAEEALFFQLVEKPFEIETLRASVRRAASAEHSGTYLAPFGVLEVDAEGSIRYANPRAREMMAETQAGPDVATLEEFVDPDHSLALDEAADHWCGLYPRTAEVRVWKVRTQAPRADGSRLLILCRAGEDVPGPLLEALLGVVEPREYRWPYKGRVLVVDDEDIYRRMMLAVLERAGASCYAAETHAEALRLLEHDPGFDLAILDFDMANRDAGDLVRRIRAIRPHLVLVGTSGVDRSAEFVARGVHRYLHKPWTIGDLLALLNQ